MTYLIVVVFILTASASLLDKEKNETTRKALIIISIIVAGLTAFLEYQSNLDSDKQLKISKSTAAGVTELSLLQDENVCILLENIDKSKKMSLDINEIDSVVSQLYSNSQDLIEKYNNLTRILEDQLSVELERFRAERPLIITQSKKSHIQENEDGSAQPRIAVSNSGQRSASIIDVQGFYLPLTEDENEVRMINTDGIGAFKKHVGFRWAKNKISVLPSGAILYLTLTHEIEDDLFQQIPTHIFSFKVTYKDDITGLQQSVKFIEQYRKDNGFSSALVWQHEFVKKWASSFPEYADF